MFQLLPCLNFAPIYNESHKMTKSKLDQELVDLFKTKLNLTSEHAFLIDQTTIEFIKNSKVLFINRGLPGSGKSTLSNRIKKQYGDNTVICAGDDFFTDEHGNYNFDKEKLHEAHESAQKKAREACKEGKSPIIADNTNVKYWEFKPYLDIAKEFNYIVLLIEPRTPHKFNVEQLFLLNKHNVPKETIQRKLKEFQIVFPFYFGWYLNEKDSLSLTYTAKRCFKFCIENCEGLKDDFMRIRANTDENLIFEYKNPSHLHCTSKYMGRSLEKNPLLKEYATNPIVTESLGKAFKLEITGFSISKRSIAAEVSLKQDEIGALWGNDLNKFEQLEVMEGLDVSDGNNNNLFDLLGYGGRAHLTIGLQTGEKAFRAGIDLVRVKLLKKLNEIDGKKCEIIETDKFEIYYFKDCLCYCKLKNSIKINTLFTGDY